MWLWCKEFNHDRINMETDPNRGFEFYNEETQSGFISMMTDELELFSVDIYNADDVELNKVLFEVLNAYNLPTEYLNKDIERCYKNRSNFIRNYKHFWVEYKPDEEDKKLVL